MVRKLRSYCFAAIAVLSLILAAFADAPPEGWRQVNEDGFVGYGETSSGTDLFVFDGVLYALNEQGWFRMDDPITRVWTQFNPYYYPYGPGPLPDKVKPIGDFLYARESSHLYWMPKGSDPNGLDWTLVTSVGLPGGVSPLPMTLFKGKMYGVYNDTAGGTFEIWRTADLGMATATWEQVVTNSFGDPTNNKGIDIITVFNNHIYAGTTTLDGTFGDPNDYGTGVEIWESSSGDLSSWSQVNTDGFGTTYPGCLNGVCNFAIHQVIGSAAAYQAAGQSQPYLYVGTKSHFGAEVWRYDGTGVSGWTNVTPAWAGPCPIGCGPGRDDAMVVYQGSLYLAEGYPTANLAKYDGTNWAIVVTGPTPFDPLNGGLASLAILKSKLYVSTLHLPYTGTTHGDQVWAYPMVKPDDLLATWDGSGVWCRNAVTGLWVKLAAPANLITACDPDWDYEDDLVGTWPGSNGVWVKDSGTGGWTKIAITAYDISSGDMDGDDVRDLVGTWDGKGVYCLWYSIWVKLATPALQVAAGDLDGDDQAELIGVWTSGLWVRSLESGAWLKISGNLPTSIASGDMNGDGRDDVVGNWSSGVWYRNSATGKWVLMSSTAAILVAAGEFDGDGKDDLIGVWTNGFWVKKSSTMTWIKISGSPLPRDIAAGVFRTETKQKTAGFLSPLIIDSNSPGANGSYQDFSSKGPGGWSFRFEQEKNLVPFESHPKFVLGPGDPGLQFEVEENLVPISL